MGFWEQMHNPDFNVTEFSNIRNEAGSNGYVLSSKQWIEKTNAIGIISKPGRYGGTYAHKDIAFEFGSWISAEFKLYLIKEFQRLKEIENNQYNLEWNVKRIISKANYHIHTDAIKEHIVPTVNLEKDKEWLVYAEEADLLNGALFGCTARQWRDANPEHAAKKLNDLKNKTRNRVDCRQVNCLSESLSHHVAYRPVKRGSQNIRLVKPGLKEDLIVLRTVCSILQIQCTLYV